MVSPPRRRYFQRLTPEDLDRLEKKADRAERVVKQNSGGNVMDLTDDDIEMMRQARQDATQTAGSSAPAYSVEELYIALHEALKLQKHYAELLNMHDGGQRLSEVFASPETWIARLRETGNLPNAQVEPRNVVSDALFGVSPIQPTVVSRLRTKRTISLIKGTNNGARFLSPNKQE